MKLFCYEFKAVIPFGDGEYKTIYELTLLETRLFGLIKRVVKSNYEISMFGSIEKHEKHWDSLIASGAKLK